MIPKCRDGQGRKCDNDGAVRLVGPEGDTVPGVIMCREHAQECIDEYAEKLGETWSTVDIH